MWKSWMTSCAFLVMAACHAGAHVGPVHAGGGVDPVVQYQVRNLGDTIAFYKRLGFALESRNGPTAELRRDGLTLILNGPGATPTSRVVLYVDNIERTYDAISRSGTYTSTGITRPARGTQIVLRDPDGNEVELRERPKAAVR